MPAGDPRTAGGQGGSGAEEGGQGGVGTKDLAAWTRGATSQGKSRPPLSSCSVEAVCSAKAVLDEGIPQLNVGYLLGDFESALGGQLWDDLAPDAWARKGELLAARSGCSVGLLGGGNARTDFWTASRFAISW
jgi:hypothetical protein